MRALTMLRLDLKTSRGLGGVSLVENRSLRGARIAVAALADNGEQKHRHLTPPADLGIFRYIFLPSGGSVAQIHIKLADAVHNRLQKRAGESNVSIQGFAEQSLGIAAEVGLPKLHSLRSPRKTDDGKIAKFTFIDLFSGIGGTRLAFEAAGGKCMFSSEWDKYSQKTYLANHREMPHGDITKIEPSSIPEHDILVAGFPCQPFSLAGVSKKNSLGRAHGFKDKTQGTLFFNIVKILEAKHPKMFLLENVKNLRSHDKGNTYRIILGALDELGYQVFDQIVDAKPYVPQHRERILIVGLNRKAFGDKPSFTFPKPPNKSPKLGSILEEKVDPKYILTNHLWKYLQDYAEKHRLKGNGFGFGLVNELSVTRTLSARYHKDGSEILVERKGGNPRRLTPRECARLMGFPETFKIDSVSDTQAYRQFGNSVVVPAITAVAKEMASTYLARCRPVEPRRAK